MIKDTTRYVAPTPVRRWTNLMQSRDTARTDAARNAWRFWRFEPILNAQDVEL